MTIRFGLAVGILLVLPACGSDGSTSEPVATATAPPSLPTTVPPPTTTVAPPTTVEATTTTVAPDASTTTSSSTTVTTTVPPATTSAPATTTLEVEEETKEVDLDRYDFTAVAPIIEDYLTETGLNGAGLIVVERADGVVFHDHWGEFGPDRISLIASSSKMVVAGVLMRLHDEGLLDIDAPVSDVVAWGSGNPDITPAHLISNSSGLVGLLPNPAYGPYLCQFFPVGSLQDCAENIFNTTDDDADIVAPDTEFRYGGGQWQVAGAVAEVASGRSWAELIDETYVQPCGLDVLAFNNPFTQFDAAPFTYPAAFNGDPSTLVETDNPNLEGGAYTTTSAYGALLLMHLRDGMCGDHRVLSTESLTRMHADRIREAYDGEAWGTNMGYGMGWWIDHGVGRITDGGAFGTQPWLDLGDGYGAYLVVEATSTHGGELSGRLHSVVEEAVLAAKG